MQLEQSVNEQTSAQILKIMLIKGTRAQMLSAAKELRLIPQTASDTPEVLEQIRRVVSILTGEEVEIQDLKSKEDPGITEVRQEIIDNFAHHWELNDRAHQREHFEAVFQTAKHISTELKLGYQEVDMLFAAYFHDFFAWTRINHHEMAYQYFMTTDHPLIVKYFGESELQREMVAFACREHRASYKGTFAGTFSELINSADRCFPGDVKALLQRTYDHRLSTHPDISEDERMALCIGHMKDKAGSKGYARYPDLYLRVFGDKLKEQMAEIDKL